MHLINCTEYVNLVKRLVLIILKSVFLGCVGMEDLLNHDRIKDNAIKEKSCQREQKNAVEDMNRMCSIYILSSGGGQI